MAKQVYTAETGSQCLEAEYIRDRNNVACAEGWHGAPCSEENWVNVYSRRDNHAVFLNLSPRHARELAKQLNRAARFAETGK